MFDPFSVLGLDPETTTLQDARARYKSLARKYHPDVSGGDTAHMSRITRAWQQISTPDRLSEASRAIQARRLPPEPEKHSQAHIHDVRTSDGMIHLGPYTRGTCAKEAAQVLIDTARAHRKNKFHDIIRGRFSRLRSKVSPPEILIPAAFSLTEDRLYFFVEGPIKPGPSLLTVPAMRCDGEGGVSYSGAAAQSLEIDIPEDCTGILGLGTSLVRGGSPFDAILVIEEASD
jgi:hypothetical protein